MTEDEAKTKWCPFARYKFASTSDNPSSNREGGPGAGNNPWLLQGTLCIGSSCMAWRWAEQPRAGKRLNPDKPNLTDRPGSGYCGLAGSPQ